MCSQSWRDDKLEKEYATRGRINVAARFVLKRGSVGSQEEGWVREGKPEEEEVLRVRVDETTFALETYCKEQYLEI
jgi:hypothetical protein